MKNMLFILLVLVVSIRSLFADYLSIDIGSTAKHAEELGTLNEDNHWKGIGVHKEFDKYSIGVEYSDFINSYDDYTQFFTVTGTWTPLSYRDIAIGTQFSVGYQRGYEAKGVFMGRCDEGDKCESMLVIPSFYAELGNIYLSITGVPNALVATRFGVKAVEW